MEVKNEKKVMFKDMLPIDMQAITKAGFDGRQFYSVGDDSWDDDDQDIIWPRTIYRTKPETITPNDLYEKVKYLPFSGLKSDVLDLISQLEGFKDE